MLSAQCLLEGAEQPPDYQSSSKTSPSLRVSAPAPSRGELSSLRLQAVVVIQASSSSFRNAACNIWSPFLPE